MRLYKNITATGVGTSSLNMVEAFKKHYDTGEKRFVEGGYPRSWWKYLPSLCLHMLIKGVAGGVGLKGLNPWGFESIRWKNFFF
jgi:hypothetical protein